MCIQDNSESCISAYWTFIELHSTKHLILQICHMCFSHMLNMRMKKAYPKLSGTAIFLHNEVQLFNQ
jgi:hypothetical protein